MFDPGRKQNHAPVDLADQHDNTVEPFYTPGPASTQSPEMAQYGGPRSAAPTSESGGYGYGNDGGVSRGPSSASTGGFAGYNAGGQGYNPNALGAMPEASNYVTGAGAGPSGGAGYGAAAGAGAGLAAAGAGGAAMSAKQREAYNERQRQYQAQQAYGQASGSGRDAAGSPTGQTHVTEDAGPYAEDEPQRQGGEIPPTYDSIRR